MKQYNILQYPADTGGCGTYRMMFPEMSLKTNSKDISFTTSHRPIVDQTFFKHLRVVRLQRQVTNQQARYILEFLKPMSQQIGFHLIYEIDDVITHDGIPDYNAGKDAYANEEFFSNIKNILSAMDMITVTTDELKKHYVDTYELDADKFIVIPNYLPRWWADHYDIDKVTKNFEKNKARPKILLPMPFAHFDSKDTGTKDDISHLVDYIRKTVNEYEWVFMSYVPKELRDLVQSRKISYITAVNVLNYPKAISELGINAIVAPLADNVFNRSKSNIKQLEGWAQGMPVIAQNLPCYSSYSDMLFDTAEDLDKQLKNLFSNKSKFLKLVKQNYNFIINGKSNIKYFEKGALIEKNLQQWYDIFALPQKTIELDIRIKDNEQN